MAFPANPSMNQQYPSSNPKWRWDGNKWEVIPLVVEATVEQVRALTGTGYFSPARAQQAAEPITVTAAANWTPNPNNFINAVWTVNSNRTQWSPNVSLQKGKTWSVTYKGYDGTERTMAFGNNYLGDLPVVRVTSNRFVTVFFYNFNDTQILSSAVVWEV